MEWQAAGDGVYCEVSPDLTGFISPKPHVVLPRRLNGASSNALIYFQRPGLGRLLPRLNFSAIYILSVYRVEYSLPRWLILLVEGFWSIWSLSIRDQMSHWTLSGNPQQTYCSQPLLGLETVRMKQSLLWLISLSSTSYAVSFDPLEHLGANSPWFPGISSLLRQ